MAGNWTGPHTTSPDPNAPLDIWPYRHWNSFPGVTAPQIDCPPPPSPPIGPYTIAFEGLADEIHRNGGDPEERREFVGRRVGEVFKELGIPDFYLDIFARTERSQEAAPLEAVFFTEDSFAGLSERLEVLEEDLRQTNDAISFSVHAVGQTLPRGTFSNGMSATSGDHGGAQALDGFPFPKRAIVIVDANIPFAHDRLRHSATKTRLTYFWDQDAMPGTPTPPDIGRELSASEIDDYLMTYAAAGEEALYQKYREDSYAAAPERSLPPVSTSHGSHMLDTAAGMDFLDGAVDNETAIFAVSLPNWVLAESHGGYLFPYVSGGIDRCLHLIREMTVTFNEANDTDMGVPEIFVNLSLGGVAGRHDGKSQFEIYLDALVDEPDVAAVTLSAGNHREARLHARISGEEVSTGLGHIDWRIQPEDGTPSFLQIWLPPNCDADALIWKFQPPTPNAAPLSPNLLELAVGVNEANPGTYYELADGCDVLARLYIRDDIWPAPTLSAGLSREMFVLAVRHTKDSHDRPGFGSGRTDVSGGWQISVDDPVGCLAKKEEVMLWVERDDPFGTARTNARQSYLEQPFAPGEAPDPALDRGVVKESGTLSDIATGTNTLVAAAYREADGEISKYSGRGYRYRFDPQDRANDPVIGAVADDSLVLPGLLGAGYFSGSVRRVSGTSVSAALTTRMLTGNGGIPAPSPADKTGAEVLAANFEASHRPLSSSIEPAWERKKPSLTPIPLTPTDIAFAEDYGAGRLGQLKPPRGAGRTIK